MKLILTALAMTLGFASVSQAGFLVEPLLGYEMGKLTGKATTTGVETKNDSSAVDAGLTLGFRHMGFWLGVEGDMALSGTLKPSSGSNSNYNGNTVLVDFGYDFMNRMRVRAGVGVVDSLTVKGSGTSDTTYTGGTPLKVGLGYVVASHVSINFDLMMHDYKKFKTDTLSGDISTIGFDSVKNTTYALSVSFPFSL